MKLIHALPTVAIVFLLIQPEVHANLHRGVWFWQTPSSPWGSDVIVGNTVLETQTLNFLKARRVKRLYGSYGNKPVDFPATIANWNEKLQAKGIQSQLLFSENTWIFAANWPNMETKIQERLIDFNNTPGLTTAQKFDAIHLDIEPQALGIWSGLTSTQKRDHLFNLRDMYAEVRQILDDASLPNFPVYADLPVWFDNLPIDGGSIGWTNMTERDQWFDDISDSLTGITLMPFDRDTFSSINNGVSWERTNISGATVRCGIEADIGLTGTWSSVPVFNDMMTQLEDAYGPGGAVDIQSYRQWREAIAAQPIIWVEAAMKVKPAGLDITFDTDQGFHYIITHSASLCKWHQVKHFSFPGRGQMTVPIDYDAPRGFWRVERYEPFMQIEPPAE